jgi:hypothetical protein
VEAFARSVVADPEVQEKMRQQAREGALPVPLVQMLFAYAYGKPREQQRDDQAFLDDLVAIVLKHATTDTAKEDIRAVIEAHTHPPGLRVVS